MRVVIAVLLVTVVALPACLSVCGCGGGSTVSLAYDKTATNPVLIFRETQAIAPIYNSSAPVTIIYGDEMIIEKDDSYEFVQGKAGLEDILSDLRDYGFFDMKESYSGKTPRAGGVTQVLTVNLTDEQYEVSVETGSEPAGWGDIVDAVTDVDIADSKEYIPEKLTLYAKEETGAGGLEVMPWPGDPEDLAEAAAGEGVELKGEEAEVAWKAIQDTYEKVDDIVWEGGGKYYTYVYASPVFPGVE